LPPPILNNGEKKISTLSHLKSRSLS